MVTGASGAIGGAVGRALAREGAAVVASARDPHALERVAATIRDGGGRAVAITADVTDPDALERLRTAAERQLGPVTLVAAVAGGGVAVSLASNGDRTVAVWPAAVHAADHRPLPRPATAATPPGVAGKPPTMRRRQAASQGP